MESIKLGDNEIIKRNYEYLLLAKENGFFKDGYDDTDITTCNDWIVACWIDELGKIKEDREKFVNDILPSFKKWFKNGILTTGVGSIYNALKMAEINGIKITNGAIECIWSFPCFRIDNTSSVLKRGFNSILEHFDSVEIIDNLKRFNSNGVPLLYQTADRYDLFLQLEQLGEKIDKDVFMFFYTMGVSSDIKAMDTYLDKKRIEEDYSYKVVNYDEFYRLESWLCSGGYNIELVEDLQKRINRLEDTVSKGNSLEKSSDRINGYVGSDVSVWVVQIDNNGNRERKNIKGKLQYCDSDSIVVSCVNPETGESEDISVNNSNNLVIFKINVQGSNNSLYECKTVQQQFQIANYQSKIELLQSNDITSLYFNTFGTLEGLAYLKRSANDFITLVQQYSLPKNNLFALCFENFYNDGKRNDELVRCALYVYNDLLSEKFKSLQDNNFGYPITAFLSDDLMTIATRYCNFISSTKRADELPDLTNSFTVQTEETVGVSSKRGGK